MSAHDHVRPFNRKPRCSAKRPLPAWRPLSRGFEALESRELLSIDINAAWLAAHGTLDAAGDTVYLLTTANQTYTLAVDVTTHGTAFVVGNSGITLDLNGHAVTYGDAASPTVTNGGFEQGSGRSVPGWDLSGAPAAAIAANPNSHYMYGKQMLRLSSFSTAQTIWSDAISIPVANRTYKATIVPKGYPATLQLAVVDSVTSATLASTTFDEVNVDRGFIANVGFTPTTTNAVKLKITITPTGTTTVDLDYATVTASSDYGIVASHDYWNFPGQLENVSAITTAASHAANFTVKNGFIVQGQGKGYGCSALLVAIDSFTATAGLDTTVSGIDSYSLYGNYAGAVTLQNSYFRSNVDAISNRMSWLGTIDLTNTEGSLLIEGNHIIDSPEQSIAVYNNHFSAIIRNNVITPNTIVTEGYGIALNDVHNVQIYGNSILAPEGKSARGILLDNSEDATITNVDIHDNYVDIRERGNREYGRDGLEATVLRIRSYTDGGLQDIHIYDNTFIARTGSVSDDCHAAIAFRLNYPVNTIGSSNLVENNTFKAIVETTSTIYYAKTFVIENMPAEGGMTYVNNVLESNENSLTFSWTDSGTMPDVLSGEFVSNTLRKSSDGASRTYIGVQAGSGTKHVNGVRFIDMRYEGGATSTIVWQGFGTKDVSVGWLLNVQVQNSGGGTIAGATVRLLDKDGTEVFSGTTDATGLVSGIPVVTTIYRQLGSNPGAITTDTRAASGDCLVHRA